MLAGDISRKSSSGSGPDGGSISQAADKTHSPDPDSRNQTRRERTVPARQADHHEIVKSMQKRGQCESRQCGAFQAIALDARFGTPVSQIDANIICARGVARPRAKASAP
jgi:hypothetical protein